ncbi:MAG: DUF3179 domain-containing protein [Acidimicrobiia bacterium]|nr:DUF3179 domain-containing protein [Acidimicrobiia bacterium]
MPLRRTLTVVIGIVLIAAACSSTGDDSDSTGTAAADPESDADVDTSTTSPADDIAPFDLTGGATSSDEGVVIDADDPRSSLSPDAANASGRWVTDWTRSTIDIGELAAGLGGSDTRDLIRPIDVPKFESIEAAALWLSADEPGALVQIDDIVRFYPLSILTRHEVVNDRFGDIPVAVTYCPLCNTALAFDRRVDGEVLRFGVSGLLRKSDLVMWDATTDSLWQQISGEGIVGTFAGTQLEVISTSIVSFGDFSESFPDGLSLSRDTGVGSGYGANPYAGYSSRTGPIAGFFQGDPDDRLPALERVVGVTVGDELKAYPFSVIQTQPAINDEVGGEPIAVFWGGTTTDALDGVVIAESDQIGSGIAYERTVNGQVLTFTANGDDTFTDAETSTTWNLLGQAIDGELAGAQLEVAQHRNEFWFAFSGFFPDADLYLA